MQEQARSELMAVADGGGDSNRCLAENESTAAAGSDTIQPELADGVAAVMDDQHVPSTVAHAGARYQPACDRHKRTGNWRGLVPLWACVTLMGATWWVMNNHLTTAAQSRMGKSLESVLDNANTSLSAWADRKRLVVRLWAESPDVRRLTEKLLGVDPSPQALVECPAQTELRDLLASPLERGNYQGFFVIGKNGVSLASTRDGNIGTTNLLSETTRLDRVWEGAAVVTLPQPSDVELKGKDGLYHANYPTMFAVAPIRANDRSVIAALAFRIEPFDDFASILQEYRIGRSGETYGIDRRGIMVSQSRFESTLRQLQLIRNDESSLLNIRIADPGANLTLAQEPSVRSNSPLTVMARSATLGTSDSNLLGYADYRGVPVIGHWLWNDDLQMGLTTEIDVDEAYEDLWATQRVIGSQAVLSCLLMMGLTCIGRWQMRKKHGNEE